MRIEDVEDSGAHEKTQRQPDLVSEKTEIRKRLIEHFDRNGLIGMESPTFLRTSAVSFMIIYRVDQPVEMTTKRKPGEVMKRERPWKSAEDVE